MSDEEFNLEEELVGEENEPSLPDIIPVAKPKLSGDPLSPPPSSYDGEVFLTKQTGSFPFTAIVGQEVLKRSLLLNIVNPKVGGVLIRGEKGTGKSLAVRSVIDILPEIEVNAGCKYTCDPNKPDKYCSSCKAKAERGELESETTRMKVIDLPLNITEDRLVGTIDIEKVLSEGTKEIEPGILSQAHRNVLYIDEINLLEDNIVDLLLDAAAMGMVTVEREGISFSYQSDFILVGSMNPQEGELRPQLQDRLALQAEVSTIDDIDSRVTIIKRSRDFMSDPVTFSESFEEATSEMKRSILEAKTKLPEVTTPSRMLALISRICIDFNIDGHRGDIIIERTGRTNAAFDGRSEVTTDDVIAAAEMALPHRMRKQPFEEGVFNAAMLHRLVREYEKDGLI